MQNGIGTLFTCQADACAYAISEMAPFLTLGPPIMLDDETGFAQGARFEAAAEYFVENPPLFIRHICPVDALVPLDGDGALTAIHASGMALIERMDMTLTFSVQTRFMGDRKPFTPGQITGELAQCAKELGYTLSAQSPQQILSIAVCDDTAYLGLSLATQNMSDWAGGAMRFKDAPERISRAEFKLLEALRLFPIEQTGTRAIDLGAAPGGWTRVLTGLGYAVTAVDPAALDPRVLALPGVTHQRMRAQDFFQAAHEFDLMVNDMRMDALMSAQLMNQGARSLTQGAHVIMTLKLPHDDQAHIAKRALAALGERYTLVGARQLFHNRSELTAVLKRR